MDALMKVEVDSGKNNNIKATFLGGNSLINAA